MQVTLNGVAREIRASTVAELAVELKLEGRPFAIELNRAVVPRAEFARAELRTGDRIEVVEFVGGG